MFLTMGKFYCELTEGKFFSLHGKQCVIFTRTLEWYNFNSHGLRNVVTKKSFRHSNWGAKKKIFCIYNFLLE